MHTPSDPRRGTHRASGALVGPDGAPCPRVEVELWDRDLVGHDFLGRAFTDDRGRFEVAYRPDAAGWFDLPDLELRVFERTADGRREVARIRGGDDVSALVYAFGELRLAAAPAPLPPDRVPAPPPEDAIGMPGSHPLCLPTPYSKSIVARQFLVSVDPGWLAHDLPPCLAIVPGLEGLGMWGVMEYPAAFSPADPTGAIYSFRELVMAAFVHERGRPAPGNVGLYFLAIYITTDVAVVVGREMYGFPKKEADVAIAPGRITVTRPGLAPDEPSGPVHPIRLVDGAWEPAGEAPLPAAFSRLGASGAALAMNQLFDLPFYNHQRICAPRLPDGTRPHVSRVWKAPLRDVRVRRSAPLGPATFRLGASRTDPIARAAPGLEPVVRALGGVELEVTFAMDGAELVADYGAPPRPGLRARLAGRLGRWLR